MYKRWMSLLLAMILTVSTVLPGNAIALTTDAQENTEVVDETIEATGTTDPSNPTETTDATESSDPTEVTDATEPSDPTEATDATEPSETIPEWIEDSLLNDEGISVMSLRPIAEKKAYLVVGDHDGIDISQVPLDLILDSLMDSSGNPIEIDDNAKIAWCYCKDRDGSTITDDYYLIEDGGTVDLSIYEEYDRYTLEMIVGDGNQLNPENVRYIVTVYLSNEVSGLRTYELYTQDADGTRHKVVPADQYATSMTMQGITSASRVFIVSEHVDGTEYYIGINDPIDEHPFIQCDVMDYADFLGFMMGQAFGFEYEYTNLADKFINVDMRKTDAGYKNNWNPPEVTEDSYDITKTFALLYKDSTSGAVLASELITFTVTNAMPLFEDDAFDINSSESVKLTTTSHVSLSEIKGPFDITEEDITQIRKVILNEGYSADSEYRYALYAKSPIWDNANDHVVKATAGWYDSLESAAEAEDISDQLLPKSNASGEIGYKANYNLANGGVPVSIFFDDGSVYKFLIVFQEYDKNADLNYMREFTDKPIIGEADPWVRITGATGKDGTVYSAENHNVYVVENGKAINMDTSYGYGNQTIFINDSNVDLAQLQPTIWRANSERITIYVNGILYNEGDFIDCSKTVTFTAIIDGHQKTYNVNFLKKSPDSDLYVFGATTREVFLDEYFEKKHDILIANMGNAELTGLRVELNATNCKLDEYWTIGGDGNDTLAPFTETSSDTEYGELNNLAKIRLIPVDEEEMVGNGEIEGTLTIYADGQEPVVIILTGQALNPQITTNQESFASYTAVKYVPYAYVITTSNMHDWIDTSFTMTGDLPDGMEFYPETGEIYGVPQETGEFNIRIEASFESETSGFESSSIELTLTVLDNTNENVYEASDADYQIKQHVGTQTGDYDFVLETIEDTVFTSHGEFGEFVDIWLNGEKLVEGIDYEKEEGSTKITIKSQTIEDKTNDDGSENTIAMEFRTDTDGDGNANEDGDLNRTAQNFTVKSAVEKVIEQIAALPTNINLSHKSQVQAARAAYNALSDADKAKVTNYSKLTDAEATIARLEANQSAANKVIKMINDLPSRITLNDQAAVEAARAAYDALTSAQKNLVTNYERLQDAEAAIAQLKAEHEENEKNKAAAQVVVDLIDALPAPVTLADKDAVSAARAAYNNLTADQKSYVSNYDKLTAAEATIAELEIAEKEKAEVNAVIALINRIPNPVTLDDKDTVETARAAYDALSPEQQAKVINYKTLTDAETTIAALEAQQEAEAADKSAADAVIALIDAIPEPVTLDDKDTVEAAREAYDTLTDTQKQLVSNYSDLTDAEATIKTLEDYAAAEEEDRAAADAVIELIDALPEEITLDDKAHVEEARNAYNNLTENQKSIVTNYDKLVTAESKIAELEDSEYEEMQSVTLVAIFVDAEGKPLADTAIELHSVVQNGRTDENGSILFTGVEFGEHTIYTKDANGNITALKSFSIGLGTPLSMNGNVITAESGAVFTVTIQQNGTNLTFLSVEEGNKAPEIDTDKDDEDSGIDIGDGDDDKDSDNSSGSDDSIPQTGDASHLMFWNTMMFVSLAGFFTIPFFFGRKRGKYEKRR